MSKKVNELYDFIESHYTEKDEYPKYLYDILEDFVDMEKAIKIFVSYILVCKPIDFDTYLHSFCDDIEIKLITGLLKEALENENSIF